MNKTVDGIEIDSNKVKRLLIWLVDREAVNIRSRERNDNEMVKLISKRIEEETQCL
jgi:hypothetical protein